MKYKKLLSNSFFKKKITLYKWQFNLAGLVFVLFGIGIGSLMIFPAIRALNETTYTISETGDSQFLYGDTDGVTATVADVTLSKDDNWFDLGWTKKKQVTIKNLSAIALTTGTSMQISVNTKSLFDGGNLKTNCEDLRVIYAPSAGTNTEIKRSYFVNSGATNCSNSTNTTLTFPLQADLDISATDDKYYIYYSNSSATNPNYGDDGYDIGDAQATLVCPFNGTATCVDGETPTTTSGAIRYSGGSAMSFDGVNDGIGGSNPLPGISDNFTVETWLKIPADYSGSNQFFQIGGYPAYTCTGIILQKGTSGSGSTINVHYPCVTQTAAYGSSFDIGTWQHIAIVRNNGTNNLYKNGQLIDSRTSGFIASTAGYNLNPNWSGGVLFDEFRVSDSVRYTSNFTPQTTPFEPDSNTKLLLHFDENGDDPRNIGKAIDSSGNGNHGTITGAKYMSGLVGVDSSSGAGTAQGGKIQTNPFASHQGVFVEEGTTNHITNPSFEHSTFNTNWGTNYFNYNTASATFTPSIAKRNSAGPFATGLMVQGNLSNSTVTDQINFSRGNQISGYFYQNMDENQGSVVFWITPEWNGNDNQAHYVYYDQNYDFRYIVKGTNNHLTFFYFQKQVSIDVSTWIAGSTYAVVARWDRDNTLDGTNYLALSVNDSHFFGGTSSLGGFDPQTTISLGSSGSSNPANAIIEGLTIYRRPLFDGTYGIDAGNGDEIFRINGGGSHTGSNNASVLTDVNKYWTAGALVGYTITNQTDGSSGNITANTTNTITVSLVGGVERDWDTGDLYTISGGIEGRDPTLITGSWDVVFALPTNGSTGSLASGTGNAWSHPHSSNLLYTNTTNTGGFMMNGTYGNDGFALVGSPTDILPLDATEKVYSGGYKYTSNASNQGIYRSFNATSGGDYVLRALGHSDGTCNPQIKITRADGTTEISHLDGTTGSTRTNPNIYVFTWESPATEANQIQLINTASSGTCFWHQVEVLSNKVSNPSMEWSGSSVTGWSLYNPAYGTITESNECNTGTCIEYNYAGIHAWTGTNGNGGTVSSTYFAEGFWYNTTYNRPHNYDHTTAYPHYLSTPGGIYGSNPLRGQVMRRVSSNTIHARNQGTSAKNVIDDYFVYELSDVSLTVTPASQTNSTETSGLRVDGSDLLSQPISVATPNKGYIKFLFTPRHSWANNTKFGSTNPYIFFFWDGNFNYENYFQITNSGLGSKFGGNSVTAPWGLAPPVVAGTTYLMEIIYSSDAQFIVKINGTTYLSTNMNGYQFSVMPTTAYFGSNELGGQQYDATFSNLQSITSSENTASPYYKFGSKSAKLINSGTQADDITTTLNTGSTATHMLSAYVYDGTTGNIGGTVNTSIANLFFNNDIVTTTFTDEGGGWWRLSGAINPPADTNYASSNSDTDRGLFNETSSKYLAQGFKPTENISVDKIRIWLKKVGPGTTTTRYIRVTLETDVFGLPSGTAVSNGLSNCIAVPTSTTYAYTTFSYLNLPSLVSGTNYHVVLKPYTDSACNTIQATPDDTNYLSWGYDNSSSAYFSGDRSSYDGSAYTSQLSQDHIFEIYGGKIFTYGVQIKNGKTVYIDAFQLERNTDGVGGYRNANRTYTTTYIDGSLGNGYSWSGTANSSTSIRSGGQGGSINYPISNISASAGTVSLWINRKYIDNTDKGWGVTAGFFSTHNSSEGSANINIDSLSSNIRPCGWWGTNTPSVTNKWYNIVVTWDASANARKCYVNNSVIVSGTGGNIALQTIKVGQASNWGAIYPSDAVISDLRIFNKALTPEQVSALYQNGLGTHNSGDTDVKRYKTTGTWESSILNLTANGRWGETPNFLTGETLNGNSIAYETRTSLDGINWSAYAPVLGADTEYSVDSPPNKFVQVKATLNSPNQNTTPVLNSIAMNFVQDNTPPPINTDNIVMKRTEDGGQIVEGSWTNSPSPYFFWDEVDDDQDGSGMRGYCLAISDSPLANPATSKGPFLGNSPVPTAGSTCGFIISTNYINFENDNYKSEDWLVASNSSYYLAIKAVDNTGNVYAGDAQVFEFKFDDMPPDNFTSLSTPRDSFANVNDIYVNWPSSGTAAAKDTNSGILGYQFSINNENNWNGTEEHTSLGINYIPANYSQPFYLDSERDGPSVQIGNNTIYFRAVDIAGNYSTVVRSGLFAYSGEAPGFPPSSKVTVNPTVSEINNFSFSWPAAIPAESRTIATYYYMINTSPPGSLSTILSNSSLYIPTTNTSVGAGNVAGLVKGENNIYVVAVDDIGNYSQSNFVTAEFELNSTTPDPAKNLTLSDASIKSASLWRVALAWEDPDYKGTGSLSFKIERSLDGISWQSIVVVTGNSFVDTVPDSKVYYYRVGTMDNSDLSKNNPSYTLGYSIFPKGSYTSPAKLTSEPEVTEVTTRRATIKWTTERNSDSKVAYGTNQGKYFPEEFANSNQLTNHILTLTNLLPSTTYYYLAKWTDEDGNTGVSKELTFTTEPAPIVKDVVVKNVSIDRASISFSTKSAVRVKLYYGKTTSFGAITELSISQSASSYTLPLEALEDGTKYYFRINPVDNEGVEYEGTILDFKTLPRPKVSNVKLQQMKNTAESTMLITWESNTEISSIVSYYPEGRIEQLKDEVNINLVTGEHKMYIKGLIPETNYALIVKGFDKLGNEARSDLQRFTTATDTRPPSVTDVSVESESEKADSNDPLTKNKSRIIVSWTTDEPASSRVEFAEGSGDIYTMKTTEDTNLKTNHLVIISGLSSNKVYHLRAVSKDTAANTGTSSDLITITPKYSDNAVDLILTNLKDMFSF